MTEITQEKIQEMVKRLKQGACTKQGADEMIMDALDMFEKLALQQNSSDQQYERGVMDSANLIICDCHPIKRASVLSANNVEERWSACDQERCGAEEAAAIKGLICIRNT